MLAAALFAAITAVPVILVQNELARGVVIGLGIAGTGGVLCQWIVMVTGTGPLMMGELAEQWTASELRKLRKDGWRLVNHFSLTEGDMDHVLVGPGGIVVLETKWSAHAWDDSWHTDRIAHAASSVSASAGRLRLWQPIKALGVPSPRSGVLLWGGPADAMPNQPEGTALLLHGSHAAERLRGLPTDRLSASQVDQVWAVLDKHTKGRDPKDAARWPVPPSVQELAVRLVASVIAGLGGFVLLSEILTATHSLWITVLAALVLGAGAWPLRRQVRVRSVVTGWLTGIAAVLLLIVVTAGSLALR